MYKLKRKTIIGILTLIISGSLFSSFMVNNNVSASFPGDFYHGENFTWSIDNISEGVNVWYNFTSYDDIANWNATTNGLITYEVTNSKIINEEEYLVGNLNIGNLSLVTDNRDIGINLALSVYPWYGGLISLEDDWDGLATLINTIGTSSIYTVEDVILDPHIEAKKITYNDGFQQSELVYENNTGILMSTNTSAGNFWLQMHLTQSSIPIPSETQSFPVYSAIIISSISFILVIHRQKKK